MEENMSTHHLGALRPFARYLVLLVALLTASGCGGVDTHDDAATHVTAASSGTTADLSPEAVEACQQVFARTGAPGPQIVVVWDSTASVADMPFPTGLAADIEAASKKDGSLTVIAVDGEGVAPRIIVKDAALSTRGERDRPSVAKLAAVMPSCAQALYTTTIVPTAPGTDLHRALAVAAEIADPAAIVWTVSDLLPTTGQLVLTKGELPRPADEVAATAAASAPVDLRDITWKISGLGNATSPLLSANREWVRSYAEGLCRAWHANGCDSIQLDPVNPERTATGLPADEIPQFPAVTTRSTASGCTFTLPEVLTFAGGSAALRQDADDLLTEPLGLLSSSPGATVRVVGHTASSASYTEGELVALSEARAQAVADRILAAGIDAGRVDIRGVGDSAPLAEDIDPATGRQIPEVAAAERRVDVEVQGASCSR